MAFSADASSPKKDPPSPAVLAASAAAEAEAAASRCQSPSPSPSPSPERSASLLPLPASLPPPLPPSSASRRLAAPIWTHEEILALIGAYRDKWYALRRGNLRASHWQDVADDVADRCLSGPSPPKTYIQCRHKVKKLRKRYRSERRKSLQFDTSLPPSSWVYFRKMHATEHGGSVEVGEPHRPSACQSSVPPHPPSSDDEENDDYEHRGAGGGSNTHSLHHLMTNDGCAIGELRFTIPKAVRSKVYRADDRVAPNPNAATTHFFKGLSGVRPVMEEMWRKMEKKRRRRRRMEMESSAVREMVSALRMLGDGCLRMEQRKMETAREIEKERMEMEMKRTELILDSQRRILDAFLKGLSGKKRAKVSPED
ncbi:hypothetical protein C4D60_Mb11t00180 [Musa balbisiana]|uniref:Myb/SANT-like DNA-binding domain-containing protein n=1 Tax=Musa balbisiana TaxID=52838 RepID=A0A4S8J0K2_MUSBA|nr:hypothetical protein C4D60_Mb11t00180 [Musa balbisiana]